MKMSELRDKDTGSLHALEKELAENLFAARLQNRSGQLENNSKLSLTRRDLARVKTVLRARELGLEVIETATETSKEKGKKSEAAPAKPSKKEEKAPKGKHAKKSAKAAAAPKAKAKTKSAAKSSAKKPAKKAGGKK